MPTTAPNRLRRRTRTLIAATACTGLLVSGCAGGFDDGARDGSTPTQLVAALPTDPTSMDPIRSGALVVLSVFFHTFDQLVEITPDGEMKPKLATKWTPNADLTAWDFSLRDGVKATNGEVINADDVVFSYQAILDDPASENFAYLSSLAGVEKIDDLTVRFTMKKPFSAFPRNTSLISVVPADAYRSAGPDAFARNPVGSGPYKFDKVEQGVAYDLSRNVDYWGDKPKIDRLSLRPIQSDESRVSGVLSGSLDVAQVGPTQVKTVESTAGVSAPSALSNGVVFLGVNSKQGPLTNPLVRQAIAAAIDTKAITANLLSGQAEPATSMLAPPVSGYSPKVSGNTFNPDRARQLLTRAGYAGETIPLDYATDGRIPLSSEVAQTIQGYLSAVGIRVQMNGAEQQRHTIKVRNREFKGIYLNTGAPSTLDGDLPLTDFYETAGNNNYAQDPRTAELAERQRGVTGAAREAVFSDLLSYSNDQGYFVPLYVPRNTFASDGQLDWTPRADGLFDFKGASFR